MPTPSVLWRTATLVLLCGCGQVYGDAPADRADAPAVPQSPTLAAPAPETSAPRARDAPAAGPLDPAVAACAPPDGGRPWTETGRADDDGHVYVFLEHADAGASADFSLAAVMLADGRCEGEIVSGPGAPTVSRMRIPGDGVWASLVDKSFAWHVAESGGVEPFATVLKNAYGGTLSECAPGADGEACAPAWLSERLERAGVAVAPSR